MTQPALFDPRATTDQKCSVPGCQAILWAGTERTPTCAHDLDPEKRRPRPKGCCNAIDPETTDWGGF